MYHMPKCTRKPECMFVGEFGGWCARCDAEACGDSSKLPTPVGQVWYPPPQLALFEEHDLGPRRKQVIKPDPTLVKQWNQLVR